MLNEVPNNNDVKRVANIALNEALNRNDATRVGNNVRLTVVGAQQFLMVAIDHMQLRAYLIRNRAPNVINTHMHLAVAILSGKKK